MPGGAGLRDNRVPSITAPGVGGRPGRYSGGAPMPDGDEADHINAELSREQYEDYQQRYQPIEEEYVRSISDPNFVKNGVDNTRQRMQQSETVNRGITSRNISRAGLNVTPQQMEVLDRLRKMGEAKNMTYGLDVARDQYSDMQLEGMNVAAGYGRGIARNVTEMRGNLAEQDARRDAANDAADAQQDAGDANLALTLGYIFFSSQDYKENIKPAVIDELHQMIMEIEVKEFDYRSDAPAEVAGQTNNIGAITEQMPAIFVTKDGKKVNMYNVVFSLLASHQLQAQRIAQLESRIGGV